ncbi:MAG: hypothetical protein ACOC5T_09870, partial [Elusimicrobiota bacterium]
MDKQKIKIKGIIQAKVWKQNNPLLRIWNKIVEFLFSGNMRYKLYRKGRVIKEYPKKKNVICNAGFERIVKRLANDVGSISYLNYMALGTGTPTPSASDTTLDTESYRNETASAIGSGDTLYATAFYTEAEVDGTFTEFGNFIGGSG